MVRSKTLALAFSLAVAACAAPAAKEGLDEVQTLSLRIEGVAKSIEAAKMQVNASVSALQTLARFDFKDDPADAYEDFVATVDESTFRVGEMRVAVAAMRDVAEPLFQKWEANLGTIASESMREQSRQRQAQTRARYDAIVATAESAQSAFDAFARSLGDHVAYLRYDFNAASLGNLQNEVGKLENQATLLDVQLAQCQAAARTYIDQAALPTAAATPAPKPESGAR